MGGGVGEEPGFGRGLQPGGYAWWYLDGESDDGRHALTLILFVGSVFSPYYARALRRSPAAVDADQHLGINLALYGGRHRRWLMREADGPVAPTPGVLAVGGSVARWLPGRLEVSIHDRSTPWRQPLLGTITASGLPAQAAPSHRLHPDRPHWWLPRAPAARVDVAMRSPPVRWSGRAYLDANWGQEPIARAFRRWHWQRLWHPEGTLVSYRAELDDGREALTHALLSPTGARRPAPAAPVADLKASRWRLRRQCMGEPVAVQSLEDTPFYSRSLLAAAVDGQVLRGIHEQLDLQRLGRRWVEFLLPFRMGRGR